MISEAFIRAYFQRLPNDFEIILKGKSFMCNKQSIASFSNRIKLEIQSNSSIKSFTIQEDISLEVFRAIIEFLQYKKPLILHDDGILQAFLVSSILDINIIHKRYVDVVLDHININNFDSVYPILSKNQKNWDIIINFFDSHTGYITEDKYSTNISPDLMLEILKKGKSIFQSEDSKFTFLQNYVKNSPNERSFLLSYIDSKFLSLELVNELIKSNNRSFLEQNILLFPLINSLFQQKLILEQEYQNNLLLIESKNRQKESLQRKEVSQELIDQFLFNEKQKLKQHLVKYYGICEKLEILAAQIEIVSSKKFYLKLIYDKVKFLYDKYGEILQIKGVSEYKDLQVELDSIVLCSYNILTLINELLDKSDEIDDLDSFYADSISFRKQIEKLSNLLSETK